MYKGHMDKAKGHRFKGVVARMGEAGGCSGGEIEATVLEKP